MTMWRRLAAVFLVLLGLLAAGLMLARPALADTAKREQSRERLNILWIMAEDMGPELGYTGHPQVRTPAIDSLAERGMVFDNAFATGPICSISRSAFYTGMHSIAIGAHQHRTPNDRKQPLPPGVQHLTERLHEVGYSTALLKDLGTPGKPAPFDGSRKTDWNFKLDHKPYDLDALSDLKSRQPFFAHVQFPETHRGKEWNTSYLHIPTPADPAKVVLPPYYPDHPIARDEWAQYLNTVMAFDSKVAYVLRRLQEEGLADNTVIMLTADHGRAMPRGKQWLYDSGLNVPFIVVWPEGREPVGYREGRTDRLVSLIDMTGETLSIAGAPLDGRFQGRAIYGPHAKPRDYVFGARDRADETVDQMRSVRDNRYLYIRNFMPERPYTQQNLYKETEYPLYRLMFRLHRMGLLGPIPSLFMAERKPVEELYDVAADPHQVNNLAADSKYSAELQRMRSVLEAWLVETGDMGAIPEPPEVARAINETTLKKRDEQIKRIVEQEGTWR